MSEEPTETEAEPVTLMWMRVSRDSGKTYSPAVEVKFSDTLEPLLSSTWPPCRCPLHRAQREREEDAVQLLADVRERNRWSRVRPN